MVDFVEGDRVRVKPEYDDPARILGIPTRPGTVVSVYPDVVIVAEDDPSGVEGGGIGGTSIRSPASLTGTACSRALTLLCRDRIDDKKHCS